MVFPLQETEVTVPLKFPDPPCQLALVPSPYQSNDVIVLYI